MYRYPVYTASGLSPRVRGNPAPPASEPPWPWSIPACAGEPKNSNALIPNTPVYPRVCGGTPSRWGAPAAVVGLSPRVRGNPHPPPGGPPRRGSIPACAGEPGARQNRGRKNQVYPRVCGGTYMSTQSESLLAGLSPRVRGNPHDGRYSPPVPGSIPACAGEPHSIPRRAMAHRVYPRVCGGTGIDAAHRLCDEGLSPRVRGNHQRVIRLHHRHRSIPACAGEPGRAGFPFSGGGLSPRVRGNRAASEAESERRRSIPACAGEPGCAHQEQDVVGVYPRVCGGTSAPCATMSKPGGLSPRVRGNRHRAQHQYHLLRSIPACAGEPHRVAARAVVGEVYPRVCGGTICPRPVVCYRIGLSPRVRGNRHHPAADRTGPRVYPRVCGGTLSGQRQRRRQVGLSPRVRGNYLASGRHRERDGSIPACAGEPGPAPLAQKSRRVYPRVCGGTRGNQGA